MGKRRRMEEYYMRAYYATPVAMSLFKLARQNNQKSTDLLWCAAVSLTAYYEQELVHKMVYDRIAWDELKSKLDNIADFASTPDESGNVPDSADNQDADGLIAPGSPAPGSPLPRTSRLPRALASEKRSIRFEPELKLTL